MGKRDGKRRTDVFFCFIGFLILNNKKKTPVSFSNCDQGNHNV